MADGGNTRGGGIPARTLGRTGFVVTPLGLGMAALGRPGYINIGHSEDLARNTDIAAMERRAHDVLDVAYSAGLRYVDAARSYGRAEAFVASWLRNRGLMPGAVTVGSKWGYTYTAGWRVEAERHEVKDLSGATFRRQLAESRSLLGRHLAVYQIHSATLESGVLDDRGVLEALEDLRRAGIAVGLTVTGPEQAATIERAVDLERFDAVQATWNLLERSAGEALERAHAAGVGVIVKEALANGRLTARGDVSLLARRAAERDTTPDALALASALAQPWADVVLSGAATVDALRSNLGALTVEYDEEVDSDLRTLLQDREAYWATRAALAWN